MTYDAIISSRHNYGYRYYAPSFGRWLNRDPIYQLGSSAWRSEQRPHDEHRRAKDYARLRYAVMREQLRQIRGNGSHSDDRIRFLIEDIASDVRSYLVSIITSGDKGNTYSFVSNDPHDRIDIRGLFEFCGICIYHYEPVSPIVRDEPSNPDLAPSLDGPCDYINPAYLDEELCYCHCGCFGHVSGSPPQKMGGICTEGGLICVCPPYFVFRMCR